LISTVALVRNMGPNDVSRSRTEQAVRAVRELVESGGETGTAVADSGAGAGVSELDELRAAVAAEHGLPARAARFLTGTHVDEIEQQADALARLIDRSSAVREQEEAEPLADLFTRAAAEKMRRKAALVEALHGPPTQAPDERGRFSGGFDGGARKSVPHRKPPEQEHDDLIVTLSRLSRAYGGSGF
jgi:hypothetical protein